MRALLASLVLLVMIAAGPVILITLATRESAHAPQLSWHGNKPAMVRLADNQD